jgi:hypothetical protein
MTRQAFKYGIAICHTHNILPCSHYKAKDLSVEIMIENISNAHGRLVHMVHILNHHHSF